MPAFFARQISEIAQSRLLRVYGVLISISYGVAALYWHLKGFDRYLLDDSEGICWPFLRNCQAWHVFTIDQQHAFFVTFIALSVFVGVFGFALSAKFIKVGYWGLWSLEIIRLAFLFSDYRYRMNQHYMHALVVFTFLLIPNKNRAVALLIPWFYFFAGLLKLNQEWLTGSALYGNIWFFKGAWLTAACHYVVVLELVLIWFLWAPKPLLRWLVFIQLVAFHIISYSVVDFYYPVLMLCLLTIFPLTWHEKAPLVWRDLPRLRGPELIIPALLILIHAYTLLQPGDKSLTGETRPLTLHMFDAKLSCDPHATLRFKDHKENKSLIMPLVVRIRCDPIVYLSRARYLCRQFRGQPSFEDLDLFLASHKASDSTIHVVIDEHDFCRKDPSYSIFGFNSWIKD